VAQRAYSSPGVSVTETVTPSLPPLIANPATIAIVGPVSTGYAIATERIYLTGTTPVRLRFHGINLATVAVTDTVGNTVGAGAYTVAADATDATLTNITRRVTPTAPTVSNAGVGTLTGDYQYAVSFINPQGETGIGPASATTTFTNTGANLSNIVIDTSPGTTTTGRNIYRAKVTNGVVGTFHLVATIANNTATTITNETMTDALANAAVSPPGGISDPGNTIVTYRYTDPNYYQATHFSDFDDLADAYGQPFDSNGNILSPLSFAARVAFQNGASEIIAVPSLTSADTDISSALDKLSADESVRFVVAVSGSPTVHAAVSAHCANMGSQGFYRQGIVGRDGSITAITGTTLRAAASGLNSEAMILVSPASFQIENPITGKTANIGAQYVAAAVAGAFAARDVQVSLTRKSIAGFSGINDARTATEQALDSQAGLLVLLDKGGILQIRHQVTTAPNNINTAEASIVRSKYEMAHRLRTVLDGSIVGQTLPADQAPLLVRSVVAGVLEELVTEGSVAAYANLKARTLDTDPTAIEVRYEYRPQYPINNIIVRFTINTNTGDFNLATA
jgi:hypothetical protein